MNLIKIYRGKASTDVTQGYIFSTVSKPVYSYEYDESGNILPNSKELVEGMKSFTVYKDGERVGKIKTDTSFNVNKINCLICSENNFNDNLWYEIIDTITDLGDYQTSQEVGKSLFDTFSGKPPVVTQPIEEATPTE